MVQHRQINVEFIKVNSQVTIHNTTKSIGAIKTIVSLDRLYVHVEFTTLKLNQR